jgi:hypothetical protein
VWLALQSHFDRLMIAHLPLLETAVWGGNTLYVSGWLDADLKTHTDTQSQTVGILKDPQQLLESRKLTLGDEVMSVVLPGGTM